MRFSSPQDGSVKLLRYSSLSYFSPKFKEKPVAMRIKMWYVE
jgi:hypothetical protein